MKVTETNLFENEKFKLIFRQAGDEEAKGKGYKPHTILLIRDNGNQALFNIHYIGNDFIIINAEFLKWYLPKYVIEEINKSVEIYQKSL